MYFLSRDGLRVTESNGVSITKTTSVTRYYRDGEFKYNKQNEEMYCLDTNNGYFMDAFHTEVEAKQKLKEVMYAAVREQESFEF